jgi:aryl-alcohol dehydrogenase-like predicted oxidoreductase
MYLGSIRQFGSWELFQTLLRTMRVVADNHAVTIAAVAIRWVLDQQGVASVVVGMRDANNVAENRMAFSFTLTVADMAAIDAVLQQATPSHGDVYQRERGELK